MVLAKQDVNNDLYSSGTGPSQTPGTPKTKPSTTTPVTVPPVSYCPRGKIQCGGNTGCISGVLQCDGVKDCADSSDEPTVCSMYFVDFKT